MVVGEVWWSKRRGTLTDAELCARSVEFVEVEDIPSLWFRGLNDGKDKASG